LQVFARFAHSLKKKDERWGVWEDGIYTLYTRVGIRSILKQHFLYLV
jgi:hypothetical protein